MSARLKFMIPAIICLVVLQVMCGRRSLAQSNPPKDKAGAEEAKLYGNLAIMTNYIEKGLSQTDMGPAVQAGFGYQWTQGRVGLWGSSVRYPNENATMTVQPYVGHTFLFSEKSNLTLRYAYSKYFNSGRRDSTIFSVDWLFMDYNILFERDENFEGVRNARLWFGAHKKYQLPYDLLMGVTAGYSKTRIAGAQDFLDIRGELIYLYKDMSYALGSTFNSNAKYFGPRAGVTFYLAVKVNF